MWFLDLRAVMSNINLMSEATCVCLQVHTNDRALFVIGSPFYMFIFFLVRVGLAVNLVLRLCFSVKSCTTSSIKTPQQSNVFSRVCCWGRRGAAAGWYKTLGVRLNNFKKMQWWEYIAATKRTVIYVLNVINAGFHFSSPPHDVFQALFKHWCRQCELKTHQSHPHSLGRTSQFTWAYHLKDIEDNEQLFLSSCVWRKTAALRVVTPVCREKYWVTACARGSVWVQRMWPCWRRQ